MSTRIIDGTGDGFAAEVDSSKRLQTSATTQSGFTSAVKKGDAYIISSGVQTLTTANESAILYIKSNETSDLVIDDIRVQVGPSTSGTGVIIRRDYIAPTAGTLISEEVPALAGNLLAASSKTLLADTFSGGEGKTVSGQVFVDQTILHVDSTSLGTFGGIVPKGTALGISITPPASNTSMAVNVLVTVHLLDSE